MAKNNARVRMINGIVDKQQNICGTPVCHGGWYAIAKGSDTYLGGALEMAEDLGFYQISELEIWAEQNDQLWGNIFGSHMFVSGCAFGDGTQNDKSLNSLIQIIDHWKGVKERAAKHR